MPINRTLPEKFQAGGEGMIEIFLPEIDCDTDTGITHPGFRQVVYTTRIHREIVREVLFWNILTIAQNAPGAYTRGWELKKISRKQRVISRI
ncbi:hypothetical protein [Methanoregula sp.]|uniref:hypothetical protein n=1 Tax=Methanoregula sp. TaxID=2052170 RepID=UPI0023717583|nr:hypothetical protein [Methanoregula sp.]MDD1687521.1 hypothetical protein [Methanoregula sp.]